MISNKTGGTSNYPRAPLVPSTMSLADCVIIADPATIVNRFCDEKELKNHIWLSSLAIASEHLFFTQHLPLRGEDTEVRSAS
jgi:hypothetical protein